MHVSKSQSTAQPEMQYLNSQLLHPDPFYYLLLNKYIHLASPHFYWRGNTSAEEEYKFKWWLPGFHEAERNKPFLRARLEGLMICSASEAAVVFLQAIGSRANNPIA